MVSRRPPSRTPRTNTAATVSLLSFGLWTLGLFARVRMLAFLSRNKHAAAMLALLAVAALLVVGLATRGGGRPPPHTPPAEPDDVSHDPYIFSAYSLPTDEKLMASVGNGHVATDVFSDTVYLNGLYNGAGGQSHRARVPAWANVRLNSTLTHHPYKPVYSLDTRNGVFVVKVDRERSVVTQKIYAHRFFTRALVNQIEVAPKPHVDPNFVHHEIWIAIKLMPGEDSEDIAFAEPSAEYIEGRYVWGCCGHTRVSEDPRYQPQPSAVCAYWTSVPDHLVVPQHGSRTFTFAMTVDKNRTVAKQEMINVLQEEPERLYRAHAQQWRVLHQHAGIDVAGNLKLSKMVNGIWYYLLSSLPSAASAQAPARYYGLSPVGLARGGTLQDYEGHNFWDTEMWMFPPILMLYPEQARALLGYRLDTAHVAAELARLSGNKGYRFPWESAFTGREVTQPCCPEVAAFEQHVSGCIAFAARQYLAATRDDHWLKNGGCALVTNIAEFWASRAALNYSTGLYDIAHVMGPDEDHANVTNSVFTNVVAGYALYLAQYVACQCKSYFLTEDPDWWADVAWSLALPYDARLDYHPQFAGYRRPERVKQADAVLIGYPLMYHMKQSTRLNDLLYYEGVTRASGPAMTWGMHAVGLLQLGRPRGAEALFNKSYEGYVREPFKVWSELRRPQTGAVNFLTGAGGLLQALVFGYGGLQLRLDRLVVHRPRPPPHATSLTIRGIKYLGANLTLDVHADKATLSVTSVSDEWPLVVNIGDYNVTLRAGISVTLSGEGPFTVASAPWSDCPLPADVIGQHYLRPIGT